MADSYGRGHTAVRILVVEDEESYREALQAGLAREGYDVELAADGIDGLRQFSRRRPSGGRPDRRGSVREPRSVTGRCTGRRRRCGPEDDLVTVTGADVNLRLPVRV